MIRLSSLVVQPPGSGVPASNFKIYFWAHKLDKRKEVGLLAGASPGSWAKSITFQIFERKNRTYHVYIKAIRRVNTIEPTPE